jgi:uncharacterized membrane protein (Fun14 family)
MEISDFIPPRALLILKKVAKLLLILVMIYFSLGGLASLGMIFIEAFTHQMSTEIQQDSAEFQAWLIYVGMLVMLITCAGFVFTAYLGFRFLRRDILKSKEVIQ